MKKKRKRVPPKQLADKVADLVLGAIDVDEWGNVTCLRRGELLLYSELLREWMPVGRLHGATR
jgi:hypothetical protein